MPTVPPPAHMPVEIPPSSLETRLAEMCEPKARTFEKMMTKKERDQYAALQTKLASEPGLNSIAVERALVAFRTPIRQREDAKRQKRQTRDQCIRAITNDVLSERGYTAWGSQGSASADARKSAAKEARQRMRAVIWNGGTPESIMNDLAQQWQEEYDDRTCQFRCDDDSRGTSDASSTDRHEQGDAPSRFANQLENPSFAAHDQMSDVAGMMLPPV